MADAPVEFQGSILIEWPWGLSATGEPLATTLCTVRDMDGEIVPAFELTVHAQAEGYIWAEVVTYAGPDGKMVRTVLEGPAVKGIHCGDDGKPLTATFPFLVAGMTVRGGKAVPLVMPADEFALVKRGLEVLDGLGRDWAHKVIVLGDAGEDGWPAPETREALVSLGWTPPAGEAS